MKSLSDAELMRVSNENGLAKPDDLLAAIGYGKFSARSILARLVPPEEAKSFSGHQAQPQDEGDAGGFTSVVRRVFGGDSSAIKVKGHDDLLVYRARCCNPDSRRGDRGLRHPRQGRRGAFQIVYQRSEPDVRAGEAHRGGVGKDGAQRVPRRGSVRHSYCGRAFRL